MSQPWRDWVYDDLRSFESSHSEVRSSDIVGFQDLLATNPGENACQAYLTAHPAILAAYGRSGHGEWVVPKPRLGERYVPDFIIGHGHSGGLFWTLVELESPQHRPWNLDGTFAPPLKKALDQIARWRIWIERNSDYVQRPRKQGGLGLWELRPRAPAKVVIGRRTSEPPGHFNDLRRQVYEESGIEVMSYDRFLDWPTDQASFWDRPAMERMGWFLDSLNEPSTGQ